MESFEIRRQFRDIFLLGLNEVLENYTGGKLRFSDARLEVECFQKNENDDYYEDLQIFGPLTPKEKIVCLAEVARMFLESSDMNDDKWYRMWFQATCHVIFQHGLTGALKFEADIIDEGIEKRKIFCETYNTWFAGHIEKKDMKAIKPNTKKGWNENVEELWDSLVDSTAEPWADEDFMLDTHDYPNKSDESDFRRSLSYLLEVTELI